MMIPTVGNEKIVGTVLEINALMASQSLSTFSMKWQLPGREWSI